MDAVSNEAVLSKLNLRFTTVDLEKGLNRNDEKFNLLGDFA